MKKVSLIISLFLLAIGMVACSSNTSVEADSEKDNFNNEEDILEEPEEIDEENIAEEKNKVKEAIQELEDAGAHDEDGYINAKKYLTDHNDFTSEYKELADVVYLKAEIISLIKRYKNGMDKEGSNSDHTGKYDNYESYGNKFSDLHKPDIIKHLKNINPNFKSEMLPSSFMSNLESFLESYIHISKDEWTNIYNNDDDADYEKKAKDESQRNRELENLHDSNPSIGMTAEEVVNTSWGKPDKINKTETASKISEQWVYPHGKYIYLENGVVTTIQQ